MRLFRGEVVDNDDFAREIVGEMQKCQSMIAASPCRSIAPPQAGQIIGAASAVTSSPGTVRTVTAVGHGFLYVPKSTTSRSSRGAPVCTNPSSCDGSTRKPESASPSPSSDATAA
jgi:hypothetical protein